MDLQNIFLQVWFQNRRAKWRKMDQTKKGPGRPAHNAHPQSCSGDPLSPEEIEKRELQRRQRKLNRQLEKKQAKLAAKGIHIDLATLKQQFEAKKFQFEEDNQSDDDEDELIDVVNDSHDPKDYLSSPAPAAHQNHHHRKSFSIDSLLYSKERSQNSKD